MFWKRKEREPTTSPWLEEIQKRTKKGKENHYCDLMYCVQKEIENAADDGYNYIQFKDYRKDDVNDLIQDLEAFGFKVKEVYQSYDYGGDYILIEW